MQKYQYAKYPTRGKIIDFFMKGLEIEYTNDADRKRYQRFVKEENITIDEYNEVFEYCIDAILDELVSDDKIIRQIKQRVNAFFESYIKKVQTVECYHTTQEYLNNYLLAEFFLPFSMDFSPEILRILHFKKEQSSMLQFFFQFIKTRKQLNIHQFKDFLFKELDILTNKEKTDRTLTQDIENWMRGSNYPNNSHILLLAEIFSQILTIDKKTIKQTLMIDRIIYNLDSKIIDEIFSILKNSFSKNEPNLIPQDIVLKMKKLYDITNINKVKNIEYISDFHKINNELRTQEFSTKNMPHIALSNARFHAQHKEFNKATEFYLEALKNGKNSLGKYYQLVIKEGLVVSAQITRKDILTLDNAKSPFVKFYKEAYFLKVIDSIPSEITQFFLNDMKKKFSLIFKNLYPHVTSSKGEFKVHEHGIIYTPDIQNIKLDLKRPNKWIKNKYPNPMTQLMHFSLLLKFEEVNKLLKARANPNEMRFNDNGTALTMILSNEHLDEKKIKAIRISKLLISKMSEEALNAKLPKKRMTALSMSIELGYVEIVKLLLEKGADVNQVIDLNDMSPLYYVVNQIALSKSNLSEIINNDTLPKDETILQRLKHLNDANGGSLHMDTITDDEKLERYNNIRKFKDKNKLFNNIFENVMEWTQENYKNKKKIYYEIFDLILENDPDLELKKLNTKHTVLIFATELNEVALVKKLLKKGANKQAYTIQDIQAYHYAEQNKNFELMKLLK